MAYTGTLEYTLLFEDDTTQKISIGPYDGDKMSTDVLATTKANIKDFLNNNFTSDVSRALVSKYGANWADISAARLSLVQKTVLF